jgi:hypothetical protein
MIALAHGGVYLPKDNGGHELGPYNQSRKSSAALMGSALRSLP